MANEFITIAKFGSEIEAHLAQARLDGYGIETFIVGASLAGMLPHIGTIAVELQAGKDDAERALAILAEREDSEEE